MRKIPSPNLGKNGALGALPESEPATVDPAVFHRPVDATGLRAAASLLAMQGLRSRDIAAALKLTPAAVAQLLDGGSAP